MKRYVVELSDEERAALRALTQKGKASAPVIRRAHLLLLADAGKTDEQIHDALQIGIATVERLRKRCVEEGVEAALHERLDTTTNIGEEAWPISSSAASRWERGGTSPSPSSGRSGTSPSR